jgi:hypothetical protein
MRERIKARALKAGYPIGMFGFHSFRSGFICSALLHCADNPTARGAILEMTAWVAGWAPNSAAQRVYLRPSAKATVVCTRVIKGSLSLTDPALHTSAAFHGLDVGAFSLSSFNGRGVHAEKESLLPQAPSTAP